MPAAHADPPRLSGPKVDPQTFFQEACRVFENARISTDKYFERYYKLGSHIVKLCFAGDGLYPFFTQALEHLLSSPVQNPALTVFLWDYASTGILLPPPPWGNQPRITRRGEVLDFNNDRIRTAYNADADVLSMMDCESFTAIYWTRYAQRLPGYEISSPLRVILSWWAMEHGMQLVHAAAVGARGDGVLIAGKGGSGKSTTALNCIAAGLDYISDDYCMIGLEEIPVAYSIFSSAKLKHEDTQRVPQLVPVIIHKEKSVYFLNQSLPEKIIHKFRIRALLIPRFSNEIKTTLSQAPASEGFRSLALSTLAQLAGAGQISINVMNRLVNSIPCFYLDLGNDLRHVAPAISDFLETKDS